MLVGSGRPAATARPRGHAAVTPAEDARRRLAGLLAVVVAAACGGDARSTTPRATFGSDGALARLPACSTPTPGAAAAPEHVVLPDGATVLEHRAAPPLDEVRAYVALTPEDVIAAYDGTPGVVVVTREAEVIESELLLTIGDRRQYVQARAVCQRGSQLLVVSASAGGAGALPSPRGGTPAPPTA